MQRLLAEWLEERARLIGSLIGLTDEQFNRARIWPVWIFSWSMSLVTSVHKSFPCAHAWDDGVVSSRSEASSRASIVAIVWVINSRIASRTVAAMSTSCRD
jgi:hypothetical protein